MATAKRLIVCMAFTLAAFLVYAPWEVHAQNLLLNGDFSSDTALQSWTVASGTVTEDETQDFAVLGGAEGAHTLTQSLTLPANPTILRFSFDAALSVSALGGSPADSLVGRIVFADASSVGLHLALSAGGFLTMTLEAPAGVIASADTSVTIPGYVGLAEQVQGRFVVDLTALIPTLLAAGNLGAAATVEFTLTDAVNAIAAEAAVDNVALEQEGTLEILVRLTPRTLNRARAGRWVAARIQMPRPSQSVRDIDVSSLLLNGVPVDPAAPVRIVGRVLLVRFSGPAFAATLAAGVGVEVTLTGELDNGRKIEGTDRINVL